MAPPPPPAGEQQQPQLHGVVIITLPPSDQPSKGKTITAFTYTDDAPPPPPEPVMGYPAATQVRRRPRRVLSTRRVAAAALVLGALAVAAYYCFYSDVAVQFLGMEQEAQKERNETRSFLLPLYPKARQGRALREFGDVKLAARRVDDGGRKARNKMEVAKAAAAGNNSTALLPIKGNVFPDG